MTPVETKLLTAGAGLVTLLALAGWGGKKPKKAKKPKCPPLDDVNEETVRALAGQFLEQGEVGVERIASLVGKSLYPTYNSRTVPWPLQKPYEFSLATPEELVCLYSDLQRIVYDYGVPGETDDDNKVDPDPDPVKPGDSPGKVIAANTSKTTPKLGYYFPIGNDWIFGGTKVKSVIYQALRKVSNQYAKTSKSRLAYARCVTLANATLYGSSHPTDLFPEIYCTEDDEGSLVCLWPAFMPYHEDAEAAFVEGRWPARAITSPEGHRITSGKRGFLWLPPIDEPLFKESGLVDCNMQWPDGSSTMLPPPELRAVMGAA
jgi:hypothetical protein